VTERDKNGRFAKGKSGNPNGRPPKGRAIPDLLESRREDLVNKAVEMAMEGDTQALRICLDRLTPPLKSAEETIMLPEFDPEAPLEEQARQIVASAARGEIPPTTASTLTAALQGRARVAEVDELASRIEALEKEVGNGG